MVTLFGDWRCESLTASSLQSQSRLHSYASVALLGNEMPSVHLPLSPELFDTLNLALSVYQGALCHYPGNAASANDFHLRLRTNEFTLNRLQFPTFNLFFTKWIRS